LQRHYGARSQIVLYSFGGLAIADRIPSRGHGIVISFAGPLVQIAFGFMVKELLAHSQGDSWAVTTFLSSFATVSLLWGVLNLVPIHPLDGGRILMGFLGPRLERVAYLVGALCAVALAIWIGVLWQSVWNTLLMGALAWNNFQLFLGKQPPPVFTP
jgi:membrane-associated protease RseP (regulator of RpoE activity)